MPANFAFYQFFQWQECVHMCFLLEVRFLFTGYGKLAWQKQWLCRRKLTFVSRHPIYSTVTSHDMPHTISDTKVLSVKTSCRENGNFDRKTTITLKKKKAKFTLGKSVSVRSFPHSASTESSDHIWTWSQKIMKNYLV